MLRIRNEGYGYDDLMLVPKAGVLQHRADADISADLTNFIRLKIPIASAPMKSVTEWQMASAMWAHGGLGILHRFMTIEEQVRQYQRATTNEHSWNTPLVGCALGVKHEDRERLKRLVEAGCEVFCVDVAHAHSEALCEFMMSTAVYNCAKDPDIMFIVGNVGTAEGALFLQEAGADCIKVGIGPGAACTTRTVTGFGSPMLSAISEIADAVSVPIMADGGIKSSGDIVKALAAGADTVMIGRLLAGTDEAAIPGEYFGMASKRMNDHHAPEGAEGEVEKTGPVADVLKSLTWGVRSGISYGGGKNIRDLQRNAEWIKVGHGTHVETAVRI